MTRAIWTMALLAWGCVAPAQPAPSQPAVQPTVSDARPTPPLDDLVQPRHVHLFGRGDGRDPPGWPPKGWHCWEFADEEPVSGNSCYRTLELCEEQRAITQPLVPHRIDPCKRREQSAWCLHEIDVVEERWKRICLYTREECLGHRKAMHAIEANRHLVYTLCSEHQ